MRTRALLQRRMSVTVALLVAGCASGGANEAAPDVPDPGVVASGSCVTGTVFAEGVDIAPRTFVHPMGGPRVELVGELVGNVRLLTGTTVEVCGSGGIEGGALAVTEVALRQVDGMPAALGTLTAGPAGWLLVPIGGGEPLGVTAVPTDLGRAVDRVVWVAGPMRDGDISVRSYSVLEAWR